MLTEVNYVDGGGGGNTQVGTFTIPNNGGESEEFVMPFTIKRLVVYSLKNKVSGATVNNYAIIFVYDKDVDSAYQYRVYKYSDNYFGGIPMPDSSSSICIKYVNGNKFKVNATISGYGGDFVYIATAE